MSYRGSRYNEYHGCRSRACTEGWTGRRRNYLCRKCRIKFQHDGGQLPEAARICPDCLKDPAHRAEFDKAFEAART